MIKLVIVKNPFQVWKDRVIKEIMPGATLRQMADSAGFVGMEINCTVNGNVVEAEDYKIPDNNIVVMSPVVGKSGKSILSIVAMIGLTIATGAIAGGAFSGMGAAFKAGALGAQLMAAATMTIGSLLINKYLTPKADMGSFGGENNPTYSWGGVQTMEGQNNAITMTYGKVLSAGQTIGKSVTVENDDEYLNWLVAAGEGELDITDIKLNDNPIENYNDVTAEIRRGTNDQAIIPYFNDTYSTQNLSYQLLDSEVIHTVNGNATEKVVVKIEFSNGLYYAENNGDLGKAWVEIFGWIRKKGATEWVMFFNQKVEGNQSSALRKEFTSEELTPGQYEVKLKVNARQYPVTSNRASTRVWWTALTSVVHDDFTYPNIALIGIKAKATDQLSGTPSLSFIKERKKVWVYNPYLQAYEEKDANNPAWASYDMLHLCSRLKNINTGEYEYDARGCSKDILIYDQFHEWAEFCESKRMRVNVEICQAGEILDIINKEIACIGRGSVIRFGTRYGCIWDCVKQPVQMFGMGNIIAGTFNEEFLQTSDRANAVEVTYTDAAMDYNRNTITIYSDTYDSEATEKVTQVTLNGVTDYEQAYREGKFQLYCNKYLLRTVDFDASVDAIACTVGDCILVSHDVPKWGHSGRIYSVQGNVLELPVEIEDVSKQYRIMYRTENDVIHTSDVSIVSVGDGWTTVELMATLQPDELPAVNDIFDLAVANVGTKPFVVKSITRSSDFVRKISCIEYHEAVYNEDYDIPPVNYSVQDVGVSNVANLVVRQTKTIGADGGYQYKIDASWEYDKSGTFVVYGSYDGENYTLLANGINEHEFSAMTYTRMLLFRVVTKNGLRTSSGIVANVELIDKIVIPKCTEIEAHTKYREMSDDIVRYDIEVTWTPPASDAYKLAQVWYITNGTQCNNLGVIPEGIAVSELGFNGSWVFAGIGIDSVVIPQAIIGETYKIAVCSQDVYGNTEHPALSPQKEIIVAKKTETPDTPANVDITVTDTFNVSWDEVRNADIKYYEVRRDTNVGHDAGMIVRTTETFCGVNNVTERNGNVYIFAIGAIGNVSNPAKVGYSFPALHVPTIDVESKLQGIQCKVSNIPNTALGVHWYFEGTNTNTDTKTATTSYFQSLETGVYDVTACYYDYFGDGNLSGSQMVTIEAYIPSALIQDGTIAEAKLESSLKNTLNGYGESINKLKNDIGALDGLSDLETKIQGIDKIVKELENQDFSSYLLKSETNDYINTNLISWKLIDSNKEQVNVYTKNETSIAIETALTSYTKTTDLGSALKIDEYYKKTEAQSYVSTELGKYYTKTDVDDKGYATTSAVNETLKQYVTSSGLATEIATVTTNAKSYADGIGEAAKAEAEEKLGIATQGIEQKFGSYWTADEIRQELNSYTLYTDLTRALDNYSTLDQTTTSINNIVGSYTRGDGYLVPAQELRATRNSFVVGQTLTIANSSTWWLAQYDVAPNEIYNVVLQLNNAGNRGVTFTDANNNYIDSTIASTNKTNSNANTAMYDIGEDYVTVPAGATKMWVSSRANRNNTEQTCSACIKVRKAGGTYSAITQLDDAIGLKVSTTDFNGNNIVNKINMTSTTTTIDGKLLHITGDTLFDSNVVVKGTWNGNAITADKINVTSLSAISATIGHIRTASSGARIEIGRNTGKPNLFEVIDVNGVVRVRLGEW